jgi:hypothetical protein
VTSKRLIAFNTQQTPSPPNSPSNIHPIKQAGTNNNRMSSSQPSNAPTAHHPTPNTTSPNAHHPIPNTTSPNAQQPEPILEDLLLTLDEQRIRVVSLTLTPTSASLSSRLLQFLVALCYIKPIRRINLISPVSALASYPAPAIQPHRLSSKLRIIRWGMR